LRKSNEYKLSVDCLIIKGRKKTRDESPFNEGFWARHRREASITGLLVLIVMIIALFPGVGYNATAELDQRGIIGGTGFTEGSGSRNRLFNGTIDARFNPLLYPISYLSGSGFTLRKFQGASEFWDHQGTQVKEAALLGTLFVEFSKNVPFFIVLSIIGALIILRLLKIPAVVGFLTRFQSPPEIN